MSDEKYSSFEVIQQKDMIRSNKELIRNATGDMKNHLKNVKYLKPLLNYLQDKQLQDLGYRYTDFGVAFRVTITDIKNNAFKLSKTKPDDNTIKHLLRLLILSECIQRVEYKELSHTQKLNYNNKPLKVFQALNMIYKLNDLRNSKFERLKGMNKEFNYTVLSAIFCRDLANQVFKEFTPRNDHFLIADESLLDVVDYIKENKIISLDSVSAWQDKQFLEPYDPIKNGTKMGDSKKFYVDTYKKLDDFNYWKKFNIKIFRNSKTRKRIKDLHGNALVFVYGR